MHAVSGCRQPASFTYFVVPWTVLEVSGAAGHPLAMPTLFTHSDSLVLISFLHIRLISGTFKDKLKTGRELRSLLIGASQLSSDEVSNIVR